MAEYTRKRLRALVSDPVKVAVPSDYLSWIRNFVYWDLFYVWEQCGVGILAEVLVKTETIEVPHFEGYRCVGWVIPKAGQYCIYPGKELMLSKYDWANPTLTYEKLKRYIFEETGESRPVRHKEYYKGSEGSIHRWECYEDSASNQKILRRVEE